MTLYLGDHLRTETDQIVIGHLLRKGWLQQPAAPTVQAGKLAVWRNQQWVVEAFVVPVPAEVETYKLQIIVDQDGKLAELEGVINNLPTQNGVRIKAKTAWTKKPTIRRDTQLFLAVKQALGWTDAYIDDVFRRADALNLG